MAKARELVLSAMNNPGETLMVYFMDKQSMNAKRVRLSQVKRSWQGNADVENVRVKSETLEEATKEGYTHRILIQYIEMLQELTVVVRKNGNIDSFSPGVSEDLPIDADPMRVTSLENKVEHLIMSSNLGTEEEVLAHFETFTHKPSKELMGKYFTMREKAMNRIKTGSREKMSGDFKAMKESGFGRDKAIEVYPKAPEDLLDEYFPK